jgi:hypothetical protein
LVADTLDLEAEFLLARWKRDVDILWRETIRARQVCLTECERTRAAKRRKNLQRIVRRALRNYHQIELDRQRRAASSHIPDTTGHSDG